MENWSETLLSQYDSAPTICALIESLNDAIDPQTDLAALYAQLFDVSTAIGQGLDNWGLIVGVSRNLQISSAQSFLGFAEAHVEGDYLDSFGTGVLYPGSLSSQTFTLADDAYRQLILVKAAANICELTSPALNTLLCAALGLPKYGLASAYVQDTGGMSQRYVLGFQPTPTQLAILNQTNVVPRCAGVSVSLLIAPPTKTFGFNEANPHTTFADSTFLSNSGLQNAS